MRPKAQEMLVILIHSFESLQKTFEARASEWMLTGATLSLGFVFFLNDTMFYKESFDGLRGVINSQYWWAFMFSLIGLIRLTVLCINGMYWRTPHFRALTAFLCSGIWFVFFATFVRNGSVLAALMPWIFFLDAYNVKRASREAGQSEFIQRYIKNRQEVSNAGNAQGHRP